MTAQETSGHSPELSMIEFSALAFEETLGGGMA